MEFRILVLAAVFFVGLVVFFVVAWVGTRWRGKRRGLMQSFSISTVVLYLLVMAVCGRLLIVAVPRGLFRLAQIGGMAIGLFIFWFLEEQLPDLGIRRSGS